jgi:flap endonuclease-1
VFVFDGGVTDLKSEEVADRREARERAEERKRAAEERGDAVEAARLSARTQRLTPTIQSTTRDLLDLLDVPWYDAPAEGEAQAAHQNAVGDADYVGSEDYDTLLFGAPRTLRGLTSKGDPELMDLEATLSDLDLTRDQLIDAAMLCGTDFNAGISGIGPKTALKLLREHGDLWAVLEARDEYIEHAERVRAFFRSPPVRDDYTDEYDLAIDPDVDAARAFVTDEWEVDADEVERGFERIEESLVQTGLDRWT